MNKNKPIYNRLGSHYYFASRPTYKEELPDHVKEQIHREIMANLHFTMLMVRLGVRVA